MLAEIKELQTNSVTKLVDLIDKSEKKTFTFRAPTGSGKTYMMADFMERMLSKDDKVVFLVSSLSKSDLAKQNYEKFCEYRDAGMFPRLNPYLMSSEVAGEERLFIPNDYNVYLLPRDLYKKDSRLMAGPMLNFLFNIRMTEGKYLIWIKDECHIATANLDAVSEQFFDFTVNFSATPNLRRGQHADVEITDQEAENRKLIKSVVWGDEENTVEDALLKFREIKKNYRNLLNVNPCLIIQISNKNKAEEELNNDIFPALNKYPDLKWMLIVNGGNECDTNDVFKAKKLPVKKWKDYARGNLSNIDVIIFKMVISEGWDIPRACMLYQTRNSRSEQLDEQVVGRVRRNPRLLDFETLSPEAQKLALTAWVWGVKPKSKTKSFSVRLQDDKQDIQNSITVTTTVIKPLIDKKDFDIDLFIKKQKPILAHRSIFELNRQLQSVDYSVKKLVYENASDYSKWWIMAEYIKDIAKESEQYRCDYSQSMDVGSQETFADQSYYDATNKYVNISNWVWRRRDGAEKFSFDSDAEKDWADILKDISSGSIKSIKTGKKKATNISADQTDLYGEKSSEYIVENEKNIFVWGKNYVPESTIKFEYYLGALHSSYPDFIMKDKYGRVHIFEVKSVNQSATMNIDNNIYISKVAELKKCYKQASKITDQYFYLPVQREDVWTITMYANGNESTLTVDQFRSFINKVD